MTIKGTPENSMNIYGTARTDPNYSGLYTIYITMYIVVHDWDNEHKIVGDGESNV